MLRALIPRVSTLRPEETRAPGAGALLVSVLVLGAFDRMAVLSSPWGGREAGPAHSVCLKEKLWDTREPARD